MRVCGSLMALAGLAAMASVAQAGFVVRVTVSNGPESHTWEAVQGGEVNDGSSSFQWSAGDLTGDSTSLFTFGDGAVVHGLSFDLHSDPSVSNNFNVSAGSSNSTFTIHSAIVNHPLFPSGEGRAEAIIGITNVPPPSPFPAGTASFAGLHPGGSAFRAFYNGSTVFAPGDLLAGGSTVGSQVFSGASSGPGVYLPLGGVATSIETEFKFSLSPLDRASGSSFFEVIPAPSASGLLLLAGLVAGRRRR